VVILRILDTGPGIPPDISRQLGKEPISTKDNGLGVGLFLAFSTIHRLGGVIEMTARERQLGTCTRIELPVVAQKRI
jgi:two-component system sensor histidine kinase RegB